MADETQQIDGDLADSIAMLEQILEVMPQDSMALKALYNAYNQCGHRDRAFEYLGMFADVVCDNNDTDTSKFVTEELQGFAEDFPAETSAQLARLRTLVAPVAPVAKAKSVAQSDTLSSSSSDTDISEELALAWKLYEENQLSQEEYSSVLHDLTEVSSKVLDVPVSVLHVLNDRGFNQMNRIMNYMSSRSGTPCISLRNFELNEQVSTALSLELSVHDGALPFGYFGNDLLVAVLNPFNSVLMEKVERASGHRCHAFLVSSEEYDAALSKLRTLAAAA
jgi:uncharacterized protein (UPF0297 family)